MAQQAEVSRSGVESTEATESAERTDTSEGTTAIARKILDCCVGRHNETLRDAGGTIVSTTTVVHSIFDVLVDVEFDETPRVVHSRSLGQYGIEELGFDGIETTDDGLRITTISAEYEGQLYGFQIIVTEGEDANTEAGEREGRA